MGEWDIQKRMTRNTDAAERWNSMLCDTKDWTRGWKINGTPTRLGFCSVWDRIQRGVNPSIAVRFDTSVYNRSGPLSSLLDISYSGRDVDNNG
jgi:hypothetical protein